MTDSRSDSRVIATSPPAASSARWSPFVGEDAEDLVCVCFFRTTDLRTEYMARLRAVAAEVAPGEAERDAVAERLARDFTARRAAGDDAEALVCAVRWWILVRRRAYHAYNLKASMAPFNASCLIAFDEQDADTLRYSVDAALQRLGEDRSRVLGFFGLDRPDAAE